MWRGFQKLRGIQVWGVHEKGDCDGTIVTKLTYCGSGDCEGESVTACGVEGDGRWWE